MMTTLFVADIGGTKSELAVFPLNGSVGNSSLLQKRYTNAEFPGITDIVEDFLAGCEHKPSFACLAVAGVVAGSTVTLTNLPWVIDSHLLAKRFGFQQVVLMNDLTALCSSLAILQPADLLLIQAGSGPSGEVRGVVAPGTGLGEGLSVAFGGQLFACGSEGGHTDFAPVDEEQVALYCWMRKKIRPVSYESLIAGPGLARLYDFCREYHHIPESSWIVAAKSRAKDPIPIIVSGALGTAGGSACPLCRRVVDLFLSILGSEAGNLALKLYARGGIYLGGGILPRLTDKFTFDGFLKSFHAKGLMSGLMQDIPVHLIRRKDAPLIGAAAHFIRQEYKKKKFDGS
jgi:glucokinase